MNQSIGFAGLGLMGSAMANRLLDTGYSLSVYNRTKEKAAPFMIRGARWAESPGVLAEQSDIVFSMLSASTVLTEISLGTNGILAGLRKGCIHIDCSTVAPSVIHQLEQTYSSKERFFLHVPVLGSVPQAAEGKLLLFAGGTEEGFKAAEKVIRVLGEKVWRFEQAEQASHAKLLCNFFIAGMITTLAQALAFADRASVSPTVLLDIISHSALNAPMYQTKGKSMIEQNFTPRFFSEHMLKDIRLILDAANSLGLHLPGAKTAEQLYHMAVDEGFGKEDYSAVIKVVLGRGRS